MHTVQILCWSFVAATCCGGFVATYVPTNIENTFRRFAVTRDVIGAGTPQSVRTHTVHTSPARQAIRIEDYQVGDQIIRVHEQPQDAPQISRIHVADDQHHIRVINHQSGPAYVQQVVQRQPTQVYDIEKPGLPGARIVQVIRGDSGSPTVEFVNAGKNEHYVYHDNQITHGTPAPPTRDVYAVPFGERLSAQEYLNSIAHGNTGYGIFNGAADFNQW